MKKQMKQSMILTFLFSFVMGLFMMGNAAQASSLGAIGLNENKTAQIKSDDDYYRFECPETAFYSISVSGSQYAYLEVGTNASEVYNLSGLSDVYCLKKGETYEIYPGHYGDGTVNLTTCIKKVVPQKISYSYDSISRYCDDSIDLADIEALKVTVNGKEMSCEYSINDKLFYLEDEGYLPADVCTIQEANGVATIKFMGATTTVPVTLEHMDEYDDWSNLGDATYHYHKCDDCGQVLDKKEHCLEVLDYLIPTCTADGYEKYECEECGYQKTVTIPATGHKFSSAWSKDANSHWHVCQNCGAIGSKAAHKYSAWKITKKATVFVAGSKERTCSTCGYKQVQAIAKLKATAKLNKTSVTIVTGKKNSEIKVSGLASGDKIASWKSSNTKIVKVDAKGKLTAQKKTGKANITITLKSGLKKVVKVTVVKPVPCKKIKLNKTKVTIKKGKNYTLKATLTPKKTTDKVTYTTSKKSVATVDAKGKIVAKKKGKAVITVKVGKAKAKCSVTVK